MIDPTINRDHYEELSLAKAVERMSEECRMVLPGIQALLGFQLIAVFNTGFFQHLSMVQQRLHVVALMLVAAAIGLITAPAAFHRSVHPMGNSTWLLRLGTRLLLISLLPLAVGISVDVYLIASMTFPPTAAISMAAGLCAFLIALWSVVPRLLVRRRSRG